ncbi:hypothetical protein SKAU_G00400500 [Synaphobranchus kaupii]|uniref:Uncharacterized protein n=1 Tax=Synaphobranchus kaupii TaxID=118154 RepID=A0A9Q1ICB6_SYNKA|nr:hypothetical protein SKAU_G00400500 [Synaphobranchus kaupii]
MFWKRKRRGAARRRAARRTGRRSMRPVQYGSGWCHAPHGAEAYFDTAAAWPRGEGETVSPTSINEALACPADSSGSALPLTPRNGAVGAAPSIHRRPGDLCSRCPPRDPKPSGPSAPAHGSLAASCPPRRVFNKENISDEATGAVKGSSFQQLSAILWQGQVGGQPCSSAEVIIHTVSWLSGY